MITSDLAESIENAKRLGHLPIAVLDVDLTLIENAPRTRAILRDYALSLVGVWEEASDAAVRASQMPLVFSIVENLQRLGLKTESQIRSGVEFWRGTFFTNEYCVLDEPLPGAVTAVKTLRELGCTVVYVTARTGEMLTGTIRTFQSLGFPIGVSGTALTLKDHPKQADKEFKAQALSWVSNLGSVVLCAENEPAYINLMKTTFPDAHCVLVDTRHSPGAPEIMEGVLRVESLGSFVSGERGGEKNALDT